ncbi:MAG: formylglycine-generating enzyme family protein [Gemmataceae bacterium]
MSSHPSRVASLILAVATVALWSLYGDTATGDEKANPVPTVRYPFDGEVAKKFQDDFAAATGLPKEIAVGEMKLVLIPAGTFEMGPNGSKHRVTLAKPFYIAVTEVTLGQYRKFKPKHRIEGADDEFNEDDRPAANVSWDDARAFSKWLSDQDDAKKVGREFALPTEAQWEWAARAGTATTRYFGDTDKEQAKYSWFNVTYTPNPKTETKGRGRQPVAKLAPNAWGLNDMLGNVWEWCDDRRVDEATGETRETVMRGGSLRSGAFHCTAVAHDPGSSGMKADNIGFRVVSTVTLPKTE